MRLLLLLLGAIMAACARATTTYHCGGGGARPSPAATAFQRDVVGLDSAGRAAAVRGRRTYMGQSKGCARNRGCNGPQPYSGLTLTAGVYPLPDSTAPTYAVGDTVSDAFVDGVKNGTDMVRTFLGSSTPALANIALIGQTDSNYVAAKAVCDGWVTNLEPDADYSPCTGTYAQLSSMENGNYFMSGLSDCVCKQHTYTGAPLWYLASSTDSPADGAARAIHEYTHAVQKAFGNPIPAWMMEGGAVLNECIMANRMDEISGGFSETFSQCMATGGGRGGVVKNLRQLYNTDLSVKWLTDYGADWPCGTESMPPNGAPPGLIEGQETGWIYYDAGAYAMAFAVVKANQNHATDGGRTFVDMWTAQGAKGMWHNLQPYEVDPMTGWPSQVPEGQGWKKALSEFTGYATVTDFYAAFEAHVAPAGVLQSEADLLAFLDTGSLTNAKVAELSLVQANYQSFTMRSPPESECGGGGGGGGDGGGDDDDDDDGSGSGSGSVLAAAPKAAAVLLVAAAVAFNQLG